MPRKKADAPVNEQSENGHPGNAGTTEPEEGKKKPVFKVGPIASDKNSTVEVAVWQNEVSLSDGRSFTVHNVTIHASYRDAEGTWKPSSGFRGSQLYALIYALQRASDFILSQRDQAAACPF